VKPRTTTNLELARRYLVEYFGADRSLRDITPADADQWFIHLRAKYAEATAARAIKRARQFFTAARRGRLLVENPFENIKPGQMDNRDRLFFVTLDMTETILDACPNAEWRAIIALCRYGGLRCPSELLTLTWADIDWDRGRFLVRSPKLEHTSTKGRRWVPLFPELRVHLEALFDLAPAGTVYVINRTRDSGVNLRTTFEKIVQRAGLLPWPKLFQNMRASRETELTARFPLHVVTAWIGNSAAIAAKHYLQVTEADFEVAAKSGAESGAVKGASGGQAMTCRKQGMQETPAVQTLSIPVSFSQIDSLPPAGIEPASTRLEGECIVRYATGASGDIVSRGSYSESATAQHGIGGPVPGQFAAEDVNGIHLLPAAAPLCRFRECRLHWVGQVAGLDAAQRDVRREATIFATVATEFQQRPLQGIVQPDHLTSPFSHTDPERPRTPQVREAAQPSHFDFKRRNGLGGALHATAHVQHFAGVHLAEEKHRDVQVFRFDPLYGRAGLAELTLQRHRPLADGAVERHGDEGAHRSARHVGSALTEVRPGALRHSRCSGCVSDSRPSHISNKSWNRPSERRRGRGARGTPFPSA
jgi:Phage integrase family